MMFSTTNQQPKDPYNNIPESIMKLTERKLYKIENHPLRTLINKIENFFVNKKVSDLTISGEKFKLFSDFDPFVKTQDCFDVLGIPKDHVIRRPTDTYFKSKDICMRPHTSAYQIPLMKQGNRAFLVAGDVYRKDAVDRTHYPCFHQMEGVRLYTPEEIGAKTVKEAKIICEKDLKQVLENLAREVFGDVDMRWNKDHFPFTDPSLELEVKYNNEWLEILGCGVMTDNVVSNANIDPTKKIGWAFGLGLERWAMKLFDIQDIRLFWSQDPRFINQFKPNEITKFKPYSKFPACYKDIAFWIPNQFDQNEFFQVVRQISGDLAERVECIDTFKHPKKGKTSMCFRINYRHMDRSLTNEEVDNFQIKLRETVKSDLNCQLR